jgi:hypothetical protein
MSWILDINTLIQIVSLIFVGGMAWQKIKILERDLQDLKQEVVDFRELKSDLAVIKAQLESINKSLQKAN